jgi:hypothetical protein
MAQDEWKFGIGTGISSFGLDGDIGFPLDGGGAVIFDVDLDNGDTAELFESAFGLGGYASKGKWTILYKAGTATLEDDDNVAGGALEAEWDRTSAELLGQYRFAEAGSNAFGVLFGARYTEHEWEFKTPTDSASFDEDWTDGVVGLTHSLRIGDRWLWGNVVDAAFGDSEGTFALASTITWRPFEHWSFSFGVKQYAVEFGDEDDIGDADFYLYDVDEPSVNLGFMYHW